MRRHGFTLIELLIVIAIIAILALIAIPNFVEAQMRAKVARCHADMRTMATALESYYVDTNHYPLACMAPNQDHQPAQFAHCSYLPPSVGVNGRGATALTTPIAYLTSLPQDPLSLSLPGWEERGFFYYNWLGADQHASLWPTDWTGVDPDLLEAPAPMRFNCGSGATWSSPAPNWEASPVHYTNWALLSYGPDRKFTGVLDNGVERMCVHCWLNGGHYNHMRYGLATTYDPTNGTVSRGFIWRLMKPLEN